MVHGRANVTGGSGTDPDFFIRRHLEAFAAPLVSGLAILRGRLVFVFNLPRVRSDCFAS